MTLYQDALAFSGDSSTFILDIPLEHELTTPALSSSTRQQVLSHSTEKTWAIWQYLQGWAHIKITCSTRSLLQCELWGMWLLSRVSPRPSVVERSGLVGSRIVPIFIIASLGKGGGLLLQECQWLGMSENSTCYYESPRDGCARPTICSTKLKAAWAGS